MKDKIVELIEQQMAPQLAAEALKKARQRWATLEEMRPQELPGNMSKAETLKKWAIEFLAKAYGEIK
jgi:hypothetical protein